MLKLLVKKLKKDNYITTGISFENTTISNQTIWILIDQGKIYHDFL